VEWIKKKIGPGVHNITIVEEAEQILISQDKIVVGYLDSLVASSQLLMI
jgi:protein disulfide-isomerase A1